METIRLILITLHVLIIIFTAVNLHLYLNSIVHASKSHERISALLDYTSNLLYVALYHIASIIAIWFSRHYGVGLIRATGILLIGELIQTTTWIIQLRLETHHWEYTEVSFVLIFDLLIITALLITCRLASKFSKHQKYLMQIEALAESVYDVPNDANF